MKFIGLLMVSGEDDILERTLQHNARYVDAFYVLDGTEPNDTSRAICEQHPKCAGYLTDTELKPFYGPKPRDGWRDAIHRAAVREHGPNHWFLLLHGDEVWTRDPSSIVDGFHDGYVMPLPVFFPRDGETWDPLIHPLDQLRWHLGPGYPEFRMFRGGPNVQYHPEQHFDVRPAGIRNIGYVEAPIRHYLYRSPESQRERAARHTLTGFDPDNYRHITDADEVYWTDDRIAGLQAKPHFRELACA